MPYIEIKVNETKRKPHNSSRQPGITTVDYSFSLLLVLNNIFFTILLLFFLWD